MGWLGPPGPQAEAEAVLAGAAGAGEVTRVVAELPFSARVLLAPADCLRPPLAAQAANANRARVPACLAGWQLGCPFSPTPLGPLLAHPAPSLV